LSPRIADFNYNMKFLNYLEREEKGVSVALYKYKPKVGKRTSNVTRKSYIIIFAFLALLLISFYSYKLLFPVQTRIIISTTTSLYATGLLDYLAEEFNSTHPTISVEFVAVGSGAALELAKKGDACAVLVHAPSLEKKYISEGVITYHHIFAYNFFIIVGPKDDPADVKNASSASDAFKRIFMVAEEGKTVFITRGDLSGTNVKEVQIWKETGLNPNNTKWYKNIGGGMDQALLMANEVNGYTLSDIGTYLVFSKNGKIPNLAELFFNSTELINIYSSYLVSNCTGPKEEAAKEFVDFVNNSQELIGSYGISEYGASIFYPAKGVEELLNSTWESLSRG